MGETASALKKGQVGPHKSEVGALFKGHHIEVGMYEREELDGLEAKIDAELKKAGGANYDLGNTRTGSVGSGAGSYKNTSKVSVWVDPPPLLPRMVALPALPNRTRSAAVISWSTTHTRSVPLTRRWTRRRATAQDRCARVLLRTWTARSSAWCS